MLERSLVTMGGLTSYNIGVSLAVCLGGITYGFGFAVFVTSVGQPGFYTYFNLDRKFTLLSPEPLGCKQGDDD